MTEAGWYADPSGKSEVFRWWDGERWTTWLSRERQAPAPPEAPGPDVPHPGTRRPAVAVAVGILVLVLGIGALIGVGVLQDRDTVTGPPVAPPTPLPSKSVDPNAPTYDKESHEADVGGLGATMPGEPFYVDELSEELPGVVKPARLAQALVHPNFNGDDDWYAACGIGIIEPALVVDGDIEKTGRNLWKALGKGWYEGFPFKEKNVKEEHPPNKGTEIFSRQGDLHYKIKGLDSTYDRMTIIVVDLDDGRYAAWFGTRPDDAEKALLDQYQHALDSLKKTR